MTLWHVVTRESVLYMFPRLHFWLFCFIHPSFLDRDPAEDDGCSVPRVIIFVSRSAYGKYSQTAYWENQPLLLYGKIAYFIGNNRHFSFFLSHSGCYSVYAEDYGGCRS